VTTPALVAEPWRAWLRDTWGIVRLTAVPAALTVLAAIALCTLEQSVESVRALAEDAEAGRRTGLGLLFLATVAASLLAWYWSRITLYILAPLKAKMSGESRRARLIAPYVWGFVPWAGLAIALWSASGDGIRPVLRLCVLGAIILGVLFMLACWRFRGPALPEDEVPAGQRRGHLHYLPRPTRLFLAATEACWLGLMVIIVPTHGQGIRWMNPPSLLYLAVATWIPAATFLVYLGARVSLPILRLTLLFGLLCTTFNLNDNHRVRLEGTKNPAEIHDFDAAFTSWLKGRADLAEYDPYPVFFIATEGGGLRAAYFTALVLTALQDQCPAFAQHVFAISGVSGGSVGATIFDALAARSARNLPQQPCLEAFGN
jgi:hypothetical protein